MCLVDFQEIGYYPIRIPNTLTKPVRVKVVLFDANERITKAPRDDASLISPIITAARSGFKLICAFSRNGAA